MKKVFLVGVISVALLACNSSKNATDSIRFLKEQEKNGWEIMFDGRTTKGWHRYGGLPVGKSWIVRDGVLILDTSVKVNGKIDGGDIVYEKEYENYHLKLEWMASKNANSGIIFNVHEDKTKFLYPWQTGPEMQILDNDGHAEGKINTHRAGDLFDMIASSKITVKPYNEWNLAEIRVENGKLDFYLNGENIISTMMWDENWKKIIRNSKFANMPGFGSYRKGKIALQDHGDVVSFRNVMIRRL